MCLAQFCIMYTIDLLKLCECLIALNMFVRPKFFRALRSSSLINNDMQYRCQKRKNKEIIFLNVVSPIRREMQNFYVLLSRSVWTQFHSVLASANKHRMTCLKTLSICKQKRNPHSNAISGWLCLLLCLENKCMFMSNLSFFFFPLKKQAFLCCFLLYRTA